MSKIKIMYAKKTNDIRSTNTFIENKYKKLNEDSILDSTKDLINGFALKKIERGRFNDNQKNYLLEKFNIGEINKNKKVDVKAVEKEMIKLTNRFSSEERLKAQQIKSYFYQLAKKSKEQKMPNLKTNDSDDSENNDDDIANLMLVKASNKISKYVESESEEE